VKRWAAAGTVAILLALFVLSRHSANPQMLLDTDTKVLLQNIQQRHAPFSWFVTDWPLFNHFYRPVPTLLFELDLRIHGRNGAGYGWTNAALCSACVLCLFWLLREVFDRPAPAVFGTLVFTLWQTGMMFNFVDPLTWIALLVLIVGGLRHQRKWRTYVTASLSVLFLQRLLVPLQPLESKTLDWLPGRTATSMTLFALLAMASYSRFERIGSRNTTPPAPSPLDPPATKSARITPYAQKGRALFAGLTILFTALTFATYEQAVMLPACLLGLAVYFFISGRRPAWLLQVPFWALLVGYIALRHHVIPPGASSYQTQQLRTSLAGTSMSLFDVAFPPVNQVVPFLSTLQEEGVYTLMTPTFYAQLFAWAVILTGIYQLRREWKLALTGWALAVLAFLPMAFLKMFEHYYYWPSALWTILVTASAVVAVRLSLTALSPPTLQAPPRPDPAPGSLPGR
jgi:hypothetical protein